MARSFAEIQASAEFQAETPEVQAEIRKDYFNNVIRPKVREAGDDEIEVWEDFSISHPLGKVVDTTAAPAAAVAQPEVRQTMEGQHPDSLDQRQTMEGQHPYSLQPGQAAPAQNNYNVEYAQSVVEEPKGIVDTVVDSFTGGDRVKGYANDLPLLTDHKESGFFGGAKGEQGDALDGLTNWLGGLTVNMFGGDDDIIERAKSRGGEVKQDQMGNYYVTMPNGKDYAINKAGLDVNDVAKFTAQTAPMVATGGLGAGLGLAARMGTQAAIQGGLNLGQQLAVEQAGGTDVDAGEVALTGIGGAAGELIQPAYRLGKGLIKRGDDGLAGVSQEMKDMVKVADDNGIDLRATDIYRGAPTEQRMANVAETGNLSKSAEDAVANRAAMEEQLSRYNQELRGDAAIDASTMNKLDELEGVNAPVEDAVGTGDKGGLGRKVVGAIERLPFGAAKRHEAWNQIPDKVRRIIAPDSAAASYSDEAMAALLSKGQRLRQNEISKMYDEVKTAGGPNVVFSKNTDDAIDAEIARLTKPGTNADPGDVKYLQDLKERMSGPKDLATHRENRTRLRADMGSSMNKMMGKTDLQKAGQRIYAAMSKDMDPALEVMGGKQLADKIKKADREWAEMAEDISMKRLSNAIKTGEANPAALREGLTKFNPGELKALNRTLNDDGRRSLKAAIRENIMTAVDKDGAFKPEDMRKAIDKHMPAIKEFMTERQVQELNGLRNLLSTVKGASVVSPTTKESVLTGASRAAIPVISTILGVASGGGAAVAAAAGGAAAVGVTKAINARAFRNALLRIGATKPGSLKYNKEVRTIGKILANEYVAKDRDVNEKKALKPAK